MKPNSDHHKPPTALGIDAGTVAALVQTWTEDHPAFRLLVELDGVVVNATESQQTLVYAGHVPRGVYLFLKGELALTAPCGCTEVVKTEGGAFLFPPIGELDEEAGRNAVVRNASCVVYVPRSWLVTDPTLAVSLVEVRVREVSARAQHDQHESEETKTISMSSSVVAHHSASLGVVSPTAPSPKASATAPVASSGLPNSGTRLRGRST